MSPDSHDGRREPAPAQERELPRAAERRTRWAGWIWAVPIATLLIVGYLAIREFAARGPLVTVTFPSAEGVEAGNTQVRFQGVQVGMVDSVTLQKDMRHVDIDLRLNSEMEDHLGPGTRFWIAGPQPSLSDLSSLKTIVSGPYIGMDPHPGDTEKHYQGLPAPPVLTETVPGTHLVLHAPRLGAVSRGTAIYYRDQKVGSVDDTHLLPDGNSFEIDAFVRAPFNRLLHAGTRFWNASAVQVSMTGPGPRVQMQSVPALFAGAIAFETPADEAGSAAGDGASFPLYDSKDAAENAPDHQAVPYRAVFDAADAGALDAGAAVQLAGKRVGTVQHAALQFDPQSGRLQAVVTLALEPRDIALADGARWGPDPRPQMDAMLQALIGQGLRASVGKTVPVVGADAVMLDFAGKAQPASLIVGTPPQIPSGPGSDISAIMSSVGGFANKLNAMPLDQIAQEVHRTTSRLAQLSESPELTQSLQRLDDTMRNVDQVSRQANAEITPILRDLRRVANEAQGTVADARKLLASNGAQAPLGTQSAGIGDALYELSRAARSLREFADYLDRHPEALLRGKGNG